jgi:two-component system phosphate regulon sensor histidine kinase PhoR
MADSMQLQMKQITDSEGRLKNVLDHLLVGVALTNDTGDILVYNPFLERFSKDRALQGMKLDELHVSPEFVQYWRSALEKKSDVAFEWRTYFPDERIIDVHFIPIASGMLITLHDMTSIRRLENMRSEFVANVSHELRTPLAAIRGFSETLKLGALQDPETASSFLQIILDESDRLNRLVNDLLDLSKIESNRLPLKYEQITLAPLVAEIIQLLEQQMKAKQLAYEISGQLQVTVEADRDRLRQIIINLLHNSIQYTPPNGKVLIAWETTQDKLQISVSDSGIGIPHEDLPHVFERFFRVDRARSRHSGGTGLGLSITKHLVEMHKGQITVSSELDRGSTFLITLPLKAYDHEH